MRWACSWGLEQGIVLICSPEKEDESASLQKLLPMNSTAWMDKPKRDPLGRYLRLDGENFQAALRLCGATTIRPSPHCTCGLIEDGVKIGSVANAPARAGSPSQFLRGGCQSYTL